MAFWYDGETTKEITAFGWKWEDEPHVHTMLLLPSGEYDYQADDFQHGGAISATTAILGFRDVLVAAGLVYGHNIRRYDLPLVNGWLLRHKLDPLPPLQTTDTLKDLPRRGPMSASLASLAALYELPEDKYSMSTPMWEAANQLTPEGIALARKRVSSDVLLQEKLWDKLRELKILGKPKEWRPGP